MVKKLQPVITITGKPYVPDPENYPEDCRTLENMRKLDENGINEDPIFIMQAPDTDTKIEVKIIDEEE